jgi:ABC-2 type transport system permease protein
LDGGIAFGSFVALSFAGLGTLASIKENLSIYFMMNLLKRWRRTVVREVRLICTDLSIPMVMVGGVLLYGLLYNYMYHPNVVREVPVAVVDGSHSAVGRRFTAWLQVTPQVRVAAVLPEVQEARAALRRGEVAGYCFLAPDWQQRLGRGEQAVEVTLASTASFLDYAAVRTAAGGVVQELNGSMRSQSALFLSAAERAAVAKGSPLPMSLLSLYNTTDGYATYLIPAVLMVILFQTLLMVVTMACGREREEGYERSYLLGRSSVAKMMAVVGGKCCTYLFLYLLLSLFLLGAVPWLFDLPRMATWGEVAMLWVPYMIATISLGLCLSPWCTDPEMPLLGITFFSVGLLFLSGVSYPLELMPFPWRVLHYLLPATVGTVAYVQMSAMGAEVAEVQCGLWVLWAQAAGYFLLAVVAFLYRARRLKSKKSLKMKSGLVHL